MHVITGLPRAGSTLLCNILNQNPKFRASSTSPVPYIIAEMIRSWSAQVEIKGDLQRDREGTESRLARCVRAVCTEYNDNGDGKRVIFDKSRAWLHHMPALRQAFPKCKAIVLVRDLRDVFASMEKQHLKNPLLDNAQNPASKTQLGRADLFFSPGEVVGGPLRGMKDMLDRKQDAFVLKFEEFVVQPEEALRAIYEHLGIEYYEKHKFKAVTNTATDADGMLLHKFPHVGNGDVKPPKGHWSEYVAADVAAQIVNKFPWFYQGFEYDMTTNPTVPLDSDD